MCVPQHLLNFTAESPSKPDHGHPSPAQSLNAYGRARIDWDNRSRERALLGAVLLHGHWGAMVTNWAQVAADIDVGPPVVVAGDEGLDAAARAQRRFECVLVKYGGNLGVAMLDEPPPRPSRLTGFEETFIKAVLVHGKASVEADWDLVADEARLGSPITARLLFDRICANYTVFQTRRVDDADTGFLRPTYTGYDGVQRVWGPVYPPREDVFRVAGARKGCVEPCPQYTFGDGNTAYWGEG